MPKAATKKQSSPAAKSAKTVVDAKTDVVTAKDVSKDLKKLLTSEFQMLGAELKAKQKRYEFLAQVLGKEIGK
jgi:hypothetical protein